MSLNDDAGTRALIAELVDVLSRVRSAMLRDHGRLGPSAILDVQAAVNIAAALAAGPPEPDPRDLEWPAHWTTDDKLRDLHAVYHDQRGNLLDKDECGWERCEFWEIAKFTLDAAATAGSPGAPEASR